MLIIGIGKCDGFKLITEISWNVDSEMSWNVDSICIHNDLLIANRGEDVEKNYALLILGSIASAGDEEFLNVKNENAKK